MAKIATERLTEVSRCLIVLSEAVAELDRAFAIKRTEKKVAAWFRWQGRLLLEALPELANFFPLKAQEAEVVEALSDDFDSLFDRALNVTINGGKKIFQRSLIEGLEQGYIDLATRNGLEKAFQLDHPSAVNWARENAAKHVTKVQDTTKDTIRGIVTRGVEEGMDYDTVARRITRRFKEFGIGKPQEHIESRAHLVAVTENAIAYETGGRQLVDELGAVGIEMEMFWGGPGPEDPRTSQGCLDNQAQGWISVTGTFRSGHKHPPRFPGCRHHAEYRVKRGE